jgi:predicted AAA+ superfamily ATPase
MKHSCETLAGRLEMISLDGFRFADLGSDAHGRHWLRGGFPLSFTARTESGSLVWPNQCLQAYLERDIPQSGIAIPAVTVRRF